MKKNMLWIIFATLPFLGAFNYSKNDTKCNNVKVIKSITHKKNIVSFIILMRQFAHNIENIWGINEVLIAGPKDYVKYMYQYKLRTHINFEKGIVCFETVIQSNPIVYLRQAIIDILLMDTVQNNISFYFNFDKVTYSKKPFLYGQVLDHRGLPIKTQDQASSFADYLLKNYLDLRISNSKKILFVTVHLIIDHVNRRADRYLRFVRKSSYKYGIKKELILAIIQTESSFNPYAVSSSNALGLMQIIRHSAGRDVFKMKKKWGDPTRKYLFNPRNNIDIGTAYLFILHNIYLKSIVNKTSRLYAVISAYNSGISNVLKIFSNSHQEAFNKINKMSSDEVYQILLKQHPSLESRCYLHKVNYWMKYYFQC